MLQSHVIDIDGSFMGAAVRLRDGYRFVAVDPRVEEINASHWASLAEVNRAVRRTLATGHADRASCQLEKA